MHGDEIEEQAYGRTYSLIEFERFKHISPKHMSVFVCKSMRGPITLAWHRFLLNPEE